MTDDQAIADMLNVLRSLERMHVRELIAGSPKAAISGSSLELAFRLLSKRRPTTPAAIGHLLEAVGIARRLDPAFEKEDEPGCCIELLRIALASVETLQADRRSQATSFLQTSGFAAG